ncbi:MAG: hypothetical protein LBB26_04430 [Puniceicoccales bacterium]|jgi:hypothetical protein|nr:hypothetical protein [Puniceicoccales bacterium]
MKNQSIEYATTYEPIPTTMDGTRPVSLLSSADGDDFFQLTQSSLPSECIVRTVAVTVGIPPSANDTNPYLVSGASLRGDV